jgi:hypothetical protein
MLAGTGLAVGPVRHNLKKAVQTQWVARLLLVAILLQIPLRLERQLLRFADDQVVVQHDSQRVGGILHLQRHGNIGL